MTNEQLLVECKKGLNISASSTSFDGVINQKILAVKGYMKGAGVQTETFENDLAVGAIVLGVSDLWNVDNGEVKFSPVFNLMLTQLAMAVVIV